MVLSLVMELVGAGATGLNLESLGPRLPFFLRLLVQGVAVGSVPVGPGGASAFLPAHD